MASGSDVHAASSMSPGVPPVPLTTRQSLGPDQDSPRSTRPGPGSGFGERPGQHKGWRGGVGQHGLGGNSCLWGLTSQLSGHAGEDVDIPCHREGGSQVLLCPPAGAMGRVGGTTLLGTNPSRNPSRAMSPYYRCGD